MMDISEVVKSKYRLKKVLKISIFILLFFVLALLIFEYIRITPRDVHFSNITSSSVTVSWNTKSPISATVIPFEGDPALPIRLFCFFKEKFFDSRDVTNAELKAVKQTSSNISESKSLTINSEDINTELMISDKGKYYTHHVQVNKLKPNVDYSFMIGDSLVFRAAIDNFGINSIKTSSISEQIKAPVPAYGSVMDAQNIQDILYSELLPIKDGIVYINFFDPISEKSSNIFSSSLNDSGNWYVDISLATDEEGNNFYDTYGLDSNNIKLKIFLDLGPRGRWEKFQNGYTIAPASDTVINMANGVDDNTVEEAVVKIESSSSQDVKGAMMALGRTCECDNPHECPTGYDFNCDPGWNCTTRNSVCTKYDSDTGDYCGTESGPTCYKEVSEIEDCTPCTCTPTCPNGFDWKCPEGKECTTIKSSCIPTCDEEVCGDKIEGSTCFKPKADAPVPTTCKNRIIAPYATKSSCIYYLSFSCTAPCYFVDSCDSGGDPHYVKCAQSFCDNTGIPGLDCRKEPPQEDLKCQNTSIKVGTFGYDSLNKCKKCEWTVINSYGGYGLKLTDAEETNCTPSPSCGYNNGKSFDEGTGLTSNLCSTGTPSPSTVYLSTSNNKFNWTCKSGNESISCSANVQEIVEPIVPPSASCNEGDFSSPINNRLRVCNGVGQIVYVGDYCNKVIDNQIYEWDFSGKCSPSSKCLSSNYCPAPRDCSKNYIFDPETKKCIDIYSPYNTPVLPIQEPLTEGETKCWESGIGTKLYKADLYNTYACQNGEWKELSNLTLDSKACKELVIGSDTVCNFSGSFCYNTSDDITYKCQQSPVPAFSFWVPVNNLPNQVTNPIVAVELKPIHSGEKCDYIPVNTQENMGISERCYCIDGKDAGDSISSGEWCRDVGGDYGCSIIEDNQMICDRDGTTCSEEEVITDVPGERIITKYWYCSGPKKAMLKENKLNNNLTETINDSIKLVSASNEDESILGEYIIDSTTGMFTEISDGSYNFEYNGTYYFFNINQTLTPNQSETYMIFIDNNNNGAFDDGDINVSTLASSVEITPIVQNYEYKLTSGFNFISIPFLIKDPEYRTAASLLKKLNEIYGNKIYSIAKFDSSWKIVGQNNVVFDGNDFQLLPGQGYVIKAKEDVSIILQGQPVKFETDSDQAPVTFFPGWNLVGIYGSKAKVYTAKSLLQDINAYDKIDFTVDIVNGWDKDVQGYEGFVLENESGVNMEYGFDFPINTLNSYFVRVQNGVGNWQPKLAE